ncbi:hypothetical protein A4X09_0g394 [Tilletia walkeri]|uniref:RlpA-like protein double-psi beta-barrel domain-containing protein n=1 Tax=Tilletia walkeri TaxID=117179 RepID=A0A8X7T8H3_9BASI|nr:hypothetical protein A4X09_0g394 [Tilletia walkeri]
MSNMRKSPLLFISTAILLASANAAAAAAAVAQGPMTPPSSPQLASELATFGDSASPLTLSHEARTEHLRRDPASDTNQHWTRSAQPEDLGVNLKYVSASSREASTEVSQLSPPPSPPSTKRHLTGFGSSQSGAQRPKNEVRADGAIRHGSSNAPAHLQNRRSSETGSADKVDSTSEEHGVLSAGEVAERAMEKTGGSQSRGGDAMTHGGAQAMTSRQETGLVRRRKFDGKGTYYRVGMGACGWHNDSNQLVAAISQAQYHGGGYCGKRARVCHGGGCVVVKLVDECPSCRFGSLDLSPAAFRALAPMRLGVIDISWSFA